MQLLIQLHEILHGGLFCSYVVDLYGLRFKFEVQHVLKTGEILRAAF